MIASDIILRFELQTDDSTDLSSDEELSLLNKVYTKICADRPWEFLKKEGTGSTSTTLPYVALPSDFQYVLSNNILENDNIASVFVGTDFSPYKIISWSDRRNYRNQDGYAYIDLPNSRLVFTLQPTASKTIEFDYVSTPPTLTLSDTPLIPDRFQDMIYHGMMIEDTIIQQSDKAKSYAPENQSKYKSYFDDMCYWNANLIIM